jgi:hypothetical protein
MTTLTRAAMVAATFTLLAAPHARAQSSSIRVAIASGQNAGTHEVKGGPDDCSIVNGEIRALFSPADEAGSPLPVAVDFYTVAGKGKPDGFGVQMIFLGQYNRQIKYEIHAMPPGVKNPLFIPSSGRGTVTVKKTATGQMATFRGQTKDGVRIEGTVDCRTR